MLVVTRGGGNPVTSESNKPIRIENYGDTSVDVTIYDNSTATRAASEGQKFFITLENGHEEVAFILIVKQISENKTRTVQCDANGKIMASFVLENNQLTDVWAVDLIDEVDPTIRAWWGCVKSHYSDMMNIIKGDSDLSSIADANDGLSGTPILTEIQVGISAGIHCLSRH